MLLYMEVNEDVLLVQSGDMHNLLRKVYSFTEKFHAGINSGDEKSEGVIVFTQLRSEEELSRAVGRGGPRTRKVCH